MEGYFLGEGMRGSPPGYRIQDTTLLELSASVLAGGEHLQELPGSGATSDPKDTKKYYGRGNIPCLIFTEINELGKN